MDSLLPCLLLFLRGVLSFKTGAPTSTCATMRPSHGTSGQSSSSPYTIDLLGYSSYSPGVPLTFRVTGGYRGIIIQARRADGSSRDPVGFFTSNIPNNLRRINCGNNDDTVTHSNNVEKTDEIKFEWTPPDENVGDIKFVATIVSRKAEYWIGVESNGVLKMHNAATTPRATASTAATTPHRATEASTTTVPSTTIPSTTPQGSTTTRGPVIGTTTVNNVGTTTINANNDISIATKLPFDYITMILLLVVSWKLL